MEADIFYKVNRLRPPLTGLDFYTPPEPLNRSSIYFSDSNKQSGYNYPLSAANNFKSPSLSSFLEEKSRFDNKETKSLPIFSSNLISKDMMRPINFEGKSPSISRLKDKTEYNMKLPELENKQLNKSVLIEYDQEETFREPPKIEEEKNCLKNESPFSMIEMEKSSPAKSFEKSKKENEQVLKNNEEKNKKIKDENEKRKKKEKNEREEKEEKEKKGFEEEKNTSNSKNKEKSRNVIVIIPCLCVFVLVFAGLCISIPMILTLNNQNNSSIGHTIIISVTQTNLEEYSTTKTTTIADQKIVNNYCDKDLECRSDLGLVCTGNRCICGSSSHTWSNTNQKCLSTYSKRSCLTGDSCNPDQNLKCINDQCNCPIASVDGMCDCRSTEGSEEFWNGSFCSSAKNYSDHCSNDFECQTKTQNTLCVAGSCVCSNYSLEFWNGNKCQSKKRHMETCNQKSECLDSDITNCLNNICSCPTGQYYHEGLSKCVTRLGEFEVCDNDTIMQSKKSINSMCDNDWQCSSLKGLTCQSNRCLCTLNTHTWDTTNEECRLTYSTLSCISDDDCNTSENLLCTDFTDRCNCPSNETFKICDCSNSVDKYWDGSSCVDGKSYGLFCNSSFECKVKQEKLTCRDNICQCEENEKFELNECIEKCPVGTQILNDQCLDFSTAADEKSIGQVGSFCNIDSDCSGQLLLPDGSIISTTRCTDNKCECNAPKYTVIGYDPEYRCHIANGDSSQCNYDLECEYSCNLGNNKCGGNLG
ncbi:hypothetical protein BpHYR1_000841 [Brachionus plicatilis]|uniref:SRCR domain-containing protein n=1 Tax=Brachionus plicatilis TaxID=10195 RepID=A0A3M7RCA8_BRAPC|nr:hypothetical protein BpHYR1_000841 [Brachionus plicatilis]